MENARKLFQKKSNVLYIVGICFIILINIIAWFNEKFCDAYIKYVFPIWGMTYGRLTSLLNFSIGEIMLYVAATLTVITIILLIITRIPKLKKTKFYKIVKVYGKCYAWGLWIVLWIMTLNCFILYHATGFETKYEPSALAFLTITHEYELASTDNRATGAVLDDEGVYSITANEPSAINKTKTYTYDNLATLRDYIVERANALSERMDRDCEGNIIYQGDVRYASIAAMQKMGKVYEQLDGYYVTPKYLGNSEFFSQQYICGYYFPFSMEANINDMMYITNVPPTMCHELAHTKGFIYEDDANMIGYLACINADDPFMQYCGYLSVLNYVNKDFFESIGKSKTKYSKHIRISEKVCDDNIFLTDDAWVAVEEKAVISTKVVNKVSKEFTNTTLKLNGVEEGMMQYNLVVEELLNYYDGLLY